MSFATHRSAHIMPQLLPVLPPYRVTNCHLRCFRCDFVNYFQHCIAMSSPAESPYGAWQSPITDRSLALGDCRCHPELVVDRTDFGKGTVYWIEERNDGRSVIMSSLVEGEEGNRKEWTQYPLSVTTKVHEYGGGPLTVHAGVVYFTTQNCIYRQTMPQSVADPLVDADAKLRFAEPCFGHDSLYVVCEDHSAVDDSNLYPTNRLVRIHPASASIAGQDNKEYVFPSMTTVANGADFYAAPKLSPSGKLLVWMQWDHPNMPWDATSIWLADVDAKTGTVSGNRQILGDGSTNFLEPTWASKDRLFVVADVTDWWNVYAVDLKTGGKTTKLGKNLYKVDDDLARSRWVFGTYNQTFGFDEADTCVIAHESVRQSIKSINPVQHLVVVDLKTNKTSFVTSGYTHHQAVIVRDGSVYCIAHAPDKPEAVVKVDLATGKVLLLHETFDSNLIDAGVTSVPKIIKFHTPTADAASMASGYYYAPTNDKFKAPKGTLPPVIIGAHGGPTGKALDEYSVKKQFWTSRGFAYFDVNYRGSSGFGRKFRDVLVGHCGVMDIDDCAAAAKHLVREKLADESKLCIIGGSAGGYVVLCSILRSGLYSAGVSHYGIAELAPLMAETHKFESHYDVFAGKTADVESKQRVYAERSPINKLEQIACPVAFFQGLDDKVVLPHQAINMYEAVRERGLTTALTLFEGEGHGFRQKENVKTAMYGAYYFVCKTLNIPCDVDEEIKEKVKIVNLKE